MKRLILATLLAGAMGAASAAPTYETFGPLAGATFGGTGIPNDAVAIDNFSGNTILGRYSGTIGLTAHGRFGAPAVTNDGAGTFTAQAGPGTPAALALWNFAYYFDASDLFGGGYLRLRYDIDPGAGTNFGTAIIPIVGVGPALQDSQNLGFGFLYTAVPGFLTPPAGSFNPNTPGLYTFELDAFRVTSLLNPAGTQVAHVSVDVNVVPEPPVIALLLAGLGLLSVTRRRNVTK